MVMRVAGWESRLAAVIEAARTRPYSLGEFDCFCLACQVVNALTGVDRWPEFAGRYRTKREALLLLHEHGRSFSDAARWFFGGATRPLPYARRGDIVEYRDVTGEYHLGVVTGAQFVCIHETGLIEVPMREAGACWAVGDA